MKIAAERQVLAMGKQPSGLRSSAVAALDCASGTTATGMLDPLIRALDLAVARSARAAHGDGDTALRD